MIRLGLWIPGRPAPQGSKDGNGREQSVYLPPWRTAIKRAVYGKYRELEIEPDTLPYFRGAVEMCATFRLNTGQRIDSPPDLDKLLRAMFDGLTQARVWEDDGRVTRVRYLAKEDAPHHQTGARIDVWGDRP